MRLVASPFLFLDSTVSTSISVVFSSNCSVPFCNASISISCFFNIVSASSFCFISSRFSSVILSTTGDGSNLSVLKSNSFVNKILDNKCSSLDVASNSLFICSDFSKSSFLCSRKSSSSRNNLIFSLELKSSAFNKSYILFSYISKRNFRFSLFFCWFVKRCSIDFIWNRIICIWIIDISVFIFI